MGCAVAVGASSTSNNPAVQVTRLKGLTVICRDEGVEKVFADNSFAYWFWLSGGFARPRKERVILRIYRSVGVKIPKSSREAPQFLQSSLTKLLNKLATAFQRTWSSKSDRPH